MEVLAGGVVGAVFDDIAIAFVVLLVGIIAVVGLSVLVVQAFRSSAQTKREDAEWDQGRRDQHLPGGSRPKHENEE